MELFLDNTWHSDYAQLLVHYTQLDNKNRIKPIILSVAAQELIKQNKISLPGIPCLITDKIEALHNLLAISIYLSEISFTKQFLLGEYKETNNEILQIFELSQTLKDEKVLETLNEILETRTFFVGSHITLADLSAFARVYSSFVGISDQRKWELPHLFRWYNHIQNLDRVKEYLQLSGKALSSFPKPISQEQGVQGDQNEKKKKDKSKKPGGDPELAAKAKESKKQQQQPLQNQLQQENSQDQQQQCQSSSQEAQSNQNNQKKVYTKKKIQQLQQSAADIIFSKELPQKGEGKQKQKEPVQQQQQQQQQQPSKQQEEQKTEELEPATIEEFAQLDIRVGNIIECWIHPKSENLYCEKIDLGNGEIREIASGLQKTINISEMKGLVVVATNLKPRNMAGFSSNGMVLCASNADKSKIEILRPGNNSKLGERVYVDGFQKLFTEQRLPQLIPKKKILEKSLLVMKTNGDNEATYNNTVWKTSGGVLSVATIKNGIVS